jgi:hypothetical protein
METNIYEKIQEIKKIEQNELIQALKLHGDNVDEGFEIHFEHDNPIIASYGSEDPYDAVIMAVRVDKNDTITILAEDKNYRGESHDLYVDDIFAGQLSYVTDEIYHQNK